MKKVTILDGGMGRELKRIGAPFSQPLWSAQALIEAPHFVAQAHQGFIDAGAEIITVNSYACVPFHLGEALYQAQGAALAKQAAVLSKKVAQNAKQNILVAGSLPPAFGSYRPELFESERAFTILDTLYKAQDEYVDLWIGETISSIEEAHVMASVLKSSNKPCYYAFTLNDEISEQAKLRSGELVSDAVAALLEQNVAGIFFNCSIPEVIEQALRDTNNVLTKQNKKVTLGAFANSFTPISNAHKANEAVQDYRDLSPNEYLEFAKQWHSLGANIIGGCCGINPSHIKALVQWRNSIEKP
ncbi:homocysteine S-methyltransferase family protein [Pseudoalteromonas sp. SR43-6]|uniref:homocysteine S-methyltransferase family protein n=1 Tax=unclassified Pseudoalteromonas TaxID=194690 RepID=UPI0015FDEE47|nr:MULTISPECIES: homocysteine S-methyltransferase family protein [unclassified Pseudoalteromonas]MBB1290310.1 homocysteine S-methyltransferase family protein [Pseudoalteromonas sp. SR41-5]MBB1375410.1 homocysteine S-methyltransferase family protein [Pseudoalteromonas sp. SR43-6]MBB1414658.1 homocysteine S-methyltransferase family protein [Pseudoalteromonas sp. SG43-8]